MTVTLTWFELFQAAQVGAMRQIEALKLGRPDRHGYVGDGWSHHVNGAAAELAVARATGSYWHALARRPAELPGDVGRMQVRWRAQHGWDLIVHEDDSDEALFVLVTGPPPNLTIAGALRGVDAKQSQWYGDPYGTNRPAYFVPQEALEPFAEEAVAA